MAAWPSPTITDVSRLDECVTLVAKTIERFGRIDIVVNNAGNQRFLRFAETSRADFDSLINIHLGGTFNVTAARVAAYGAAKLWPPGLHHQPSRLLRSGRCGRLWRSQGGIMALMHGIKLDCEKAGIRVNCISPFAFTRMVENLFPKELEKQIAPEHVSAAVAYLASRGWHFERRGFDLRAAGISPSPGRSRPTVSISTILRGITADAIAAQIGTITDTNRLSSYPDALAAVQVTFDRLKKQRDSPRPSAIRRAATHRENAISVAVLSSSCRAIRSPMRPRSFACSSGGSMAM